MLATPPTRLLFGVIPIYSLLIVLGICAALFFASREEKRLHLPQDTVVDLALWVIPFGVVGARLYYVLFAWDTFAPNPISVLYIWKGGLAIYGSIIGGLIGACLFSRRKRIPLPTLTDIIVPGLALAQAIGRWGNYFNMEAYGLEITNPAWQFFPVAVLIPGHSGSTWHLATFFYESVWNLLVFTALMLSRKRMHRPGDVTLWYVLLYGSGRLIIEGLRLDSLMAADGAVRVSQLLSVGMCLGVSVIFLMRTLPWHGKKPLLCLAAALVGTLALALLPCPVQAFVGYHLCWILQVFLCLFILLWCKKPHSLVVLLPLLASITLRIYLAQAGLAGVEASTLLCAAFSCTAIISGMAAYPHHPS